MISLLSHTPTEMGRGSTFIRNRFDMKRNIAVNRVLIKFRAKRTYPSNLSLAISQLSLLRKPAPFLRNQNVSPNADPAINGVFWYFQRW